MLTLKWYESSGRVFLWLFPVLTSCCSVKMSEKVGEEVLWFLLEMMQCKTKRLQNKQTKPTNPPTPKV